MQLADIFKRLGFGKNAHAVYRTLLKSHKPLLVTQIATRLGMDRPEVYRSLKKLLARTFVRPVMQGKRTYYQVENPQLIHDAFAATTNAVESAVKKLSYTNKKELPEHIRYFRGFNGIRAVFDDVITQTPRGDMFYRYTSERDLASVNRYLAPDYRVRRDKKKLERLVISNPVSGQQKRARLDRLIKYFPPQVDLFEQNIIQIIYADYVAFINLTSEEAYVIKDKNLADFQKVIFKQLYKKL